MDRLNERTYKLKNIWLKTVSGTELKNLTKEQIANALIKAGVIELRAEANGELTRYTIVHKEDVPDFRAFILDVLKRHI